MHKASICYPEERPSELDYTGNESGVKVTKNESEFLLRWEVVHQGEMKIGGDLNDCKHNHDLR